jgi:hypothetical protein
MELADLPLGWYAYRSTPSEPWRQSMNERRSKGRFRFTLRSLLLATTVWAVILAFFRVSGRESAFVALWWAILSTGFVWTLCWVARNTRKRVRLLFVMATAFVGTAAAGSSCVYYHRIDTEKVHLLDTPKLMAPDVKRQTGLFGGWTLLGGLGGAIAGAVWSWRATRSAIGGKLADNLAEPQRYEKR